MTMSAQKVHENSPNIKVSITYGPVTATVEEDYRHLRYFWGELGNLLDQMEKKTPIVNA